MVHCVDIVFVPAGQASSTVFQFIEKKVPFIAPVVIIFKSCCKRRWPSGQSNLLRHFVSSAKQSMEEDFEIVGRWLR